MTNLHLDSELLDFLVKQSQQNDTRVPSLNELSDILHVSVSKLREQLEVARCLGLVSVRPRTGIHRQDYSFMPAVRLGLFFALADDVINFDAYSELRRRVEKMYWRDAVALLTYEDRLRLRSLVQQAWDKLRGHPIRIPHPEHRQFHLAIFERLDNVFVRGILEAYWEAYEAVELHTFADYDYLMQVWQYHERIAEAIIADDIEDSLQAFDEHTRLLKNFAERNEQP
ncbi:MAG: FadR family transcriptional regulator [Anaerolineales bacterium]|nr:FadR family transcriptional regulator [Anaerolineales bacterium]